MQKRVFHKTNLIREEHVGTNYLQYRDIAPFKWLYNLLMPSFSKDQLEESNMTCYYFKVSTFYLISSALNFPIKSQVTIHGQEIEGGKAIENLNFLLLNGFALNVGADI